jgi:putative ABC transport system permease protein
VRRIDPEVAASQIRPLDHYLSDAMAPRRFSVSLMAAFATAAVALAITGIYAVVVYSVSRRAREIGIRIALGASRSSVVRLVMGHAVRFAGIGLAAGLAMAVAGMRLLSSMLFGVSTTDVATFGQVASMVAAASVIACALPTVRLERFVKGVFSAE